MSNSSDDLQFLVSDIARAADRFTTDGNDYRSGMPYDSTKVPFGCPRGGTELIDRILENTLRLIGEVHVEIGQAMVNHGYKLQKTAEQYAGAEDRSNVNAAKIFDRAEITPLPPDEPNFG